MKTRRLGTEQFHVDRGTSKLRVAFRSFAIAPKNISSISEELYGSSDMRYTPCQSTEWARITVHVHYKWQNHLMLIIMAHVTCGTRGDQPSLPQPVSLSCFSKRKHVQVFSEYAHPLRQVPHCLRSRTKMQKKYQHGRSITLYRYKKKYCTFGCCRVSGHLL